MLFTTSSTQPTGLSNADPDGILLVDKPAGMTSSDVVCIVRKMFRLKKVGHGGTLDPGATGLLVLLVGKGTRASDRVMGGEKTYEGSLKLGVTTNTQDWEGTVETEADPSGVTEEAMRAVIASDLTGDVMQVPPMVSAIKVHGQPLYKLARKGEEVERQARLIRIEEFTLNSFDNPNATFTVRCSKGTYIRTLCHDLGAKLGCGAHMTSLRRTRCGIFDVAHAMTLEQIRALPRAEFADHVIPLTVLL